VLTGEALAITLHVVQGLRVDEDRMRTNLESSGGVIMAEAATMALARHMGRLKAKDLVHDACERVGSDGADLEAVLAAVSEVSEHLTPDELAYTMEPANYLGNVGEEIDRVVAHARKVAK
jgi:3-carboxy-cis,cis-muconate cycloisomerase